MQGELFGDEIPEDDTTENETPENGGGAPDDEITDDDRPRYRVKLPDEFNEMEMAHPDAKPNKLNLTENHDINQFLESDDELAELNAAIIKDVNRGNTAGLDHYRAAGENIAKVHRKVKNQKVFKWFEYCKAVFGVDQRTANFWMALSEGDNWEKFVKPAVDEAVKNGKPASLNMGIKAIRDGKKAEKGGGGSNGEGEGDNPPRKRKKPEVPLKDGEKLRALILSRGVTDLTPEILVDLIVAIGFPPVAVVRQVAKFDPPPVITVNATPVTPPALTN